MSAAPAAAPTITEEKRALRARAGERRRLASAASPEAGEAVKSNFLAAIAPLCAPGCAISGYWPMDAELDVRPLLAALHERGHACALPVVTGRDQRLIFRAWAPGGRLTAAAFSVMVPADDAPEVVPRVVLAPLLAFDDRGYRLGWGGGYYDRTLAALRAAGGPVLAVGLGFAAQRVARVPAGPDDQRLDWVVTEADAIEVR